MDDIQCHCFTSGTLKQRHPNALKAFTGGRVVVCMELKAASHNQLSDSRRLRCPTNISEYHFDVVSLDLMHKKK